MAKVLLGKIMFALDIVASLSLPSVGGRGGGMRMVALSINSHEQT